MRTIDDVFDIVAKVGGDLKALRDATLELLDQFRDFMAEEKAPKDDDLEKAVQWEYIVMRWDDGGHNAWIPWLDIQGSERWELVLAVPGRGDGPVKGRSSGGFVTCTFKRRVL